LIERLAGYHVKFPGLDVSARRRARCLGKNFRDQRLRHRLLQKRPHRPPREDRLRYRHFVIVNESITSAASEIWRNFAARPSTVTSVSECTFDLNFVVNSSHVDGLSVCGGSYRPAPPPPVTR